MPEVAFRPRIREKAPVISRQTRLDRERGEAGSFIKFYR